MDNDMSAAVQHEAAQVAGQEMTHANIAAQVITQSAVECRQAVQAADRNLDRRMDNAIERLNSGPDDSLGPAAQQWLDAAGQDLEAAQTAAQAFIQTIAAGLQSAGPEQEPQLQDLAVQCLQAIQDYASQIDHIGEDVAEQVTLAVDNDQPNEARDALDLAAKDSATLKDAFEQNMAQLNQMVDAMNLDTSRDQQLQSAPGVLDGPDFSDREIDQAFEQADATGKGLREVELKVNIDHIEAVNEPGITPAQSMERATEILSNLQFLDSMTNQATKNNFVERDRDRTAEPAAEVSVKDNPSALFDRDWKDITEMREICDHVLENANLEGKDADEVARALLNALREEMKDPQTEAGKAVNEALRLNLNKQEGENDFFGKKRR